MIFRRHVAGLGRPALLGAALLLASALAVAAAPSRLGLVSFQRVPIPDDVPAHLASALAQDRAGFLWIGTQDGLVRSDGYGYRVYKPDPNDPRSLGGSYVRTLLAASDGRVWAGTFSGGVSVYDPATEKFVRYRHDPQNAGSLSHDHVEGLAEDSSGHIWIATYEGLNRLDPRTGQIDHFRHDPEDPQSLVDVADLGPLRRQARWAQRLGRYRSRKRPRKPCSASGKTRTRRRRTARCGSGRPAPREPPADTLVQLTPEDLKHAIHHPAHYRRPRAVWWASVHPRHADPGERCP